MTRVAINGFGRIGRAFVRAMYARKANITLVAINDLGDAKTLAYLLKYDSVYGRASFSVGHEHDALVIDGLRVPVSHELDPAKLPWKTYDVDVVVESTGVFTSYEKSKAHLTAGAKRVVISAPVKDSPEAAGVTGATVLIGVNQEKAKTCTITSNASCTTNAASPLIGILDEAIGIEKAILNTVHGYTASQALVDGPSKKDRREGRAAALNLVPTSTGSAIAVTQAYTGLNEKFDGIAVRVPVPAGSLVDVTFIAKRPTTVAEVNGALTTAAQSERWKHVFAVTEDELVSTDIVGEPYGAIAQLDMTRVVAGNLVKVLAWYDNEMGYAHTLVQHVAAAGMHL